MGDVIQLRSIAEPEIETDHYFGGCPHCGETDGYINVGRNHWFVCDRHHTKWWAGSNLFSSWRDETEEQWLRNEYKLENYLSVEPVHPKPTPEQLEEGERMERQSAICRALGAVMSAGEPIDPDDPCGFGGADRNEPFVERPDRLFIMTGNGHVYDLDRAEAEAAYEAHLAGDGRAIATLLAKPTAVRSQPPPQPLKP